MNNENSNNIRRMLSVYGNNSSSRPIKRDNMIDNNVKISPN